MKNLNKYDFIAKMFTGNDEKRVALTQPGVIDNYLFATDAYSIIRIKKELCNGEYLKDEKFPQSCNQLFFDVVKELTNSEIIKTDDLMLRIFNLNPSFDFLLVDCEKCEGIGQLECNHYGHDGDCPKCNGDGSIEHDNPFSMIEINGSDLWFYEKKYAPKFIYRVIEVALILKEEEIKVFYNGEKAKLFFEIGNVEIIVIGKI